MTAALPPFAPDPDEFNPGPMPASDSQLAETVNRTIGGAPPTIIPDTIPIPHPIDPKRPRRYMHAGGGKLPKGCGPITTAINRLDEALRAAVEETRGREPTIGELLTIQTVLRWEQHARLCQKWLIENPGTEGGHKLSAEIPAASQNRDKHLDRLNLSGEAAASLAELLYARIGG